jgi:hypothetical protein
MTEAEAHETIREALSNGLSNPNFYVLLKVSVSDLTANSEVLDLDDLVRSANQWLDALDPDGPVADRKNFDTEYGPVTVSLRALPWKREVRGLAGPGKVGPHFPVITDGMTKEQ